MIDIDNLIIGGGIFGLFSLSSSPENEKSLLIEKSRIFTGASRFNQARLHIGAHYLRSVETAKDCRENFEWFKSNFSESIFDEWKHLYILPRIENQISPEVFENILDRLEIPWQLYPSKIFSNRISEKCYLIQEPSLDLDVLKRTFLSKVKPDDQLMEHSEIQSVEYESDYTLVKIFDRRNSTKKTFKVHKRIIFCTYSSFQQSLEPFGLQINGFKKEKAHMLYSYLPDLQHLGITAVDGAYVSAIPYGSTGLHSISSVRHTHNATANQEEAKVLIENHLRSFFTENIEIYTHAVVSRDKIFWDSNPHFDRRVTEIRQSKSINSIPIYFVLSSKISSIKEIATIFVS